MKDFKISLSSLVITTIALGFIIFNNIAQTFLIITQFPLSHIWLLISIITPLPIQEPQLQ